MFDEAVHSLTAAVHMLTARVKPAPKKAADVDDGSSILPPLTERRGVFPVETYVPNGDTIAPLRERRQNFMNEHATPQAQTSGRHFPFLAVLLCAMGSFILLLMMIDKRAKDCRPRQGSRHLFRSQVAR